MDNLSLGTARYRTPMYLSATENLLQRTVLQFDFAADVSVFRDDFDRERVSGGDLCALNPSDLLVLSTCRTTASR